MRGRRGRTTFVTNLAFAVESARVEPYAVVPGVVLRLRITESSGVPVQAIALRAQVQIEPRRRRYDSDEERGIVELFGEPQRFGDTLRSVVWAHVSVMVLAFTGETHVDVPLPCSYDFDIAAHKYLSAMRAGDIPLSLLFTGTVFTRGENGFAPEFVPWSSEATYRLPVELWREAVEANFPNSAWLRVRRDVFDRLYRFKAERGYATWEAALEALLGTGVAAT